MEKKNARIDGGSEEMDRRKSKSRCWRVKLVDLKRKKYSEVLKYQTGLQDQLINAKMSGKKNYEVMQTLIFVEHEPVFTLGRNGGMHNLLLSKESLKSKNIDFHHIGRGGDITYHGPGQLVAYPIFDLHAFGLSIKEYVWSLEEVMIRTLGSVGILGQRIKGQIGVWITKRDNHKCKIGAIGVNVSRGITLHGLALNIDNSLNYYDMINPCGIKDENMGITTMKIELERNIDLEDIKARVRYYFSDIFRIQWE